MMQQHRGALQSKSSQPADKKLENSMTPFMANFRKAILKQMQVTKEKIDKRKSP